MRAEAALPDDEQRPQHEQAGQHQARHHAGEEQPADRGLGGDAVEDEGDRRRDQDAERAAGADRAGGDVVRIAAAAHLRNAHLADRRAAGRRRAGQRGEDRAGAEVGDDEAAGQAVEPAVERLVEVLAGRRRADRRAHHHEHRDRHQREIVEARPERLGDDVQPSKPWKISRKTIEIAPRPNATGMPDSSIKQRHDENERALGVGLTGVSQRLLGLSARTPRRLLRLDAERRRAPGHQADQLGDVLQDQQARARSASTDRESTAARATPCSERQSSAQASYQ